MHSKSLPVEILVELTSSRQTVARGELLGIVGRAVGGLIVGTRESGCAGALATLGHYQHLAATTLAHVEVSLYDAIGALVQSLSAAIESKEVRGIRQAKDLSHEILALLATDGPLTQKELRLKLLPGKGGHGPRNLIHRVMTKLAAEGTVSIVAKTKFSDGRTKSYELTKPIEEKQPEPQTVAAVDESDRHRLLMLLRQQVEEIAKFLAEAKAAPGLVNGELLMPKQVASMASVNCPFSTTVPSTHRQAIETLLAGKALEKQLVSTNVGQPVRMKLKELAGQSLDNFSIKTEHEIGKQNTELKQQRYSLRKNKDAQTIPSLAVIAAEEISAARQAMAEEISAVRQAMVGQ